MIPGLIFRADSLKVFRRLRRALQPGWRGLKGCPSRYNPIQTSASQRGDVRPDVRTMTKLRMYASTSERAAFGGDKAIDWPTSPQAVLCASEGDASCAMTRHTRCLALLAYELMTMSGPRNSLCSLAGWTACRLCADVSSRYNCRQAWGARYVRPCCASLPLFAATGPSPWILIYWWVRAARARD